MKNHICLDSSNVSCIRPKQTTTLYKHNYPSLNSTHFHLQNTHFGTHFVRASVRAARDPAYFHTLSQSFTHPPPNTMLRTDWHRLASLVATRPTFARSFSTPSHTPRRLDEYTNSNYYKDRRAERNREREEERELVRQDKARRVAEDEDIDAHRHAEKLAEEKPVEMKETVPEEKPKKIKRTTKFIEDEFLDQPKVWDSKILEREKMEEHSEMVKETYNQTFPPLYERRVDVESARVLQELYREGISVKQKLAHLPKQRTVLGGIVNKIEASVRTRGKGKMSYGHVIEELVKSGKEFEAVLLLRWYKHDKTVHRNYANILRALYDSEHPGLAAEVVQLSHEWQLPLSSQNIVLGLKAMKETVDPDNAAEKLKSAYQMCDWALAPSPENGNEPQFKDAEYVLPHMLYFAWSVPNGTRTEVSHLVDKVCPAFKVDTTKPAFLTQYFSGVSQHANPHDEEATLEIVDDAVEMLQKIDEIDGALMSSIILAFREQYQKDEEGVVDFEQEIGDLKWKHVMEMAFRAIRPQRKRIGALSHLNVKRELATCVQLLGICAVLGDNQLARNWFHNYVLPVVEETDNKDLTELDKNGNMLILNVFNIFAALERRNIALDDSRELFESVMTRIGKLDNRTVMRKFVAETCRLERIVQSRIYNESEKKKLSDTVTATHKRVMGALPNTCVLSKSLIKSLRYTIGDAAADYHSKPYMNSVLIEKLYLWDPKYSHNRAYYKNPANEFAVAQLYELLQAEYVIMKRSSPKKTLPVLQLLHVMMHRLSSFVPGGVTPELVMQHRDNQVLMNIISKETIAMPYDSDGKEPQWLVGPEAKPETAEEIAKAQVTKKFGARPKSERIVRVDKRRGTKRLVHKPKKSLSGDEILNSMLSMPDQINRG